MQHCGQDMYMGLSSPPVWRCSKCGHQEPTTGPLLEMSGRLQCVCRSADGLRDRECPFHGDDEMAKWDGRTVAAPGIRAVGATGAGQETTCPKCDLMWYGAECRECFDARQVKEQSEPCAQCANPSLKGVHTCQRRLVGYSMPKPTPAAMLGEAVALIRRTRTLVRNATEEDRDGTGLAIRDDLDDVENRVENLKREAEARDGRGCAPKPEGRG